MMNQKNADIIKGDQIFKQILLHKLDKHAKFQE